MIPFFPHCVSLLVVLYLEDTFRPSRHLAPSYRMHSPMVQMLACGASMGLSRGKGGQMMVFIVKRESNLGKLSLMNTN
jgi:hypothetical protein